MIISTLLISPDCHDLSHTNGVGLDSYLSNILSDVPPPHLFSVSELEVKITKLFCFLLKVKGPPKSAIPLGWF